ncbi:hypothetical protein RGP13_000019 [Morganella morganii]|uniref:hypothetical protein n=1 Tax=Morganella morganii TaxID=582 RepID=UPI0014050948|nr:hypothetical protein [Morganella morganii]ELA9130812.1 hypothetical protein [Morganella morganii]HEI8006644.1 hypothetical protein [Morganella morganii]
MDWAMKPLGALLVIMVVIAAFLADALGDVKKERDSLQSQLSAQQVINTTTFSAISIRHRTELDNIKAKETEDTENVKIKTVIRTEFKDSECAVTPVSPGIVGKLQQYERDIRARAGGPDPATTDR